MRPYTKQSKEGSRHHSPTASKGTHLFQGAFSLTYSGLLFRLLPSELCYVNTIFFNTIIRLFFKCKSCIASPYYFYEEKKWKTLPEFIKIFLKECRSFIFYHPSHLPTIFLPSRLHKFSSQRLHFRNCLLYFIYPFKSRTLYAFSGVRLLR